jgi:hypothetical protein
VPRVRVRQTLQTTDSGTHVQNIGHSRRSETRLGRGAALRRLTATMRSSRVSRAFQTSPMPPAPNECEELERTEFVVGGERHRSDLSSLFG